MMNRAAAEMIAADLMDEIQDCLWPKAVPLAALKTNMACNAVNTAAPDAMRSGETNTGRGKHLMPFAMIGAVAL